MPGEDGVDSGWVGETGEDQRLKKKEVREIVSQQSEYT